MNEIAIYFACAAGVALPTVPGFIQLRVSKGDVMRIDQQYTRDPRYLGKAWRKAVRPMLTRCHPGERVPFLLRKNEFARVEQEVYLTGNVFEQDVLLARGDVRAEGHASLLDVFAAGHIAIGPDSEARSLAADNGASIGDRTLVTRWIDVEGDLEVGRYCDLGSTASATGAITVEPGTHFRRMFAPRIAVGGLSTQLQPLSPRERDPKNARVIKSGELVEGDVIERRDVVVSDGGAVAGSIKCEGNVRLGTSSQVQGSVIARGNVTMEPHATVLGHVFSERSVALAGGATVGSPGDLKTVQATDGMQLSPGATIYGWAICERGGTTVAGGA
jgi:predicted acyltransferase (DUF342 family)